MSSIESPFVFRPGTSLLHRWSGTSGSALRTRLVSKCLVWIALTLGLFAFNAAAQPQWALLVSSVTFALCLLTLALTVGPKPAQQVLREAGALLGLGFIVGLPVYLGVGSVLGIVTGTLTVAAATIAVLLGSVIGAVGLAAVFMSTTSLALALGRLGSRGRWHVAFAIVLTYFPRFGERLRLANVALESLGLSQDRPDGVRRWTVGLRRHVSRRLLLVTAEVWSIVSVLGPQLALTVAERMREAGAPVHPEDGKWHRNG